MPCILGDALDPDVLRSFLAYDVIFFGPPLSTGCDGHHALAFDAGQPGFAAFSDLLLGDLHYEGTLICIEPKTTHMGDIRCLYDCIRLRRADFSLRLIYHSYATVTGAGLPHEPRLKYVELWFSTRLLEHNDFALSVLTSYLFSNILMSSVLAVSSYSVGGSRRAGSD